MAILGTERSGPKRTLSFLLGNAVGFVLGFLEGGKAAALAFAVGVIKDGEGIVGFPANFHGSLADRNLAVAASRGEDGRLTGTLGSLGWGKRAKRRMKAALAFSCRELSQQVKQYVKSPINYGAGGGGRTHTLSRVLDFESSASANSATPATNIIKPLRMNRWLPIDPVLVVVLLLPHANQ